LLDSRWRPSFKFLRDSSYSISFWLFFSSWTLSIIKCSNSSFSLLFSCFSYSISFCFCCLRISLLVILSFSWLSSRPLFILVSSTASSCSSKSLILWRMSLSWALTAAIYSLRSSRTLFFIWICSSLCSLRDCTSFDFCSVVCRSPCFCFCCASCCCFRACCFESRLKAKLETKFKGIISKSLLVLDAGLKRRHEGDFLIHLFVLFLLSLSDFLLPLVQFLLLLGEPGGEVAANCFQNVDVGQEFAGHLVVASMKTSKETKSTCQRFRLICQRKKPVSRLKRCLESTERVMIVNYVVLFSAE